ncbi:MAG TPA: hypothetical protein VI076_05015 [Actinopolymorphaceae bacterium]
MREDTGPTGLGRRRRRLSDEETERRTLQAAIDMVHRSGLTVSLEHISFEEVIRKAGVARSAAYRKWPYKDLFFSDLLEELARGDSPAIAVPNREAIETIGKVVLDRLDWLVTPSLRLALAAEVLRRGALDEFETFRSSTAWRTYLALHATFVGLPDGRLRDKVQAALGVSERRLIEGIAMAYERLTGLLGLRLRPDLGITFEAFATLANAFVRGLVLSAPTNPDLVNRRTVANPFGAPESAEWSDPALGMAALATAFIEPDPDVTWDDHRTDELRQALESGSWSR